MDNREDLIKALGSAFESEETKKAPEYKFEEIMVSNQRCSRLLDIKPTALRARELSSEMSTINALSKFLQTMNSEESRRADAKLRTLCANSEEDEGLFKAISEIAKDVTDRMRGLSPDSPQLALLVVYTANCLNKLG